MKNLKEFKALIERYRSITIEEITQKASIMKNFDAEKVAHLLTGYGYSSSCSLCMAAHFDCTNCVYSIVNNSDDENHTNCGLDETYQNISKAKTPEELLTAFRKRADYMETLLKKTTYY